MATRLPARQRLLLALGPAAVFYGCRGGLSRVRTVLRTGGSDTMVNLSQAWAEEYAHVRPDVSVEVSGGGSAAGIASLIDGFTDLAASSRRVEPEEIAASLRRWNRRPQEWIVGEDALAVFVHPANPLTEVTLPQLAAVYQRSGAVRRWSDLGVTLPGSRPDDIILVSRQSNSGTFQYFRRALLGKRGDFRLGTLDLNGSKEVISLISHTPNAIGYSGMGYATADVKTLRIAARAGAPAVLPTAANAQAGRYPITRPLYLYTLGHPSPALRDYLHWIQSAPGQLILEQAGYVNMAHAGAVTHAP